MRKWYVYGAGVSLSLISLNLLLVPSQTKATWYVGIIAIASNLFVIVSEVIRKNRRRTRKSVQPGHIGR